MLTPRVLRYEIADGGADWDEAERSVAAGKSTTVSVKGQHKEGKRKAESAFADAQKEATALREKKLKKKGR